MNWINSNHERIYYVQILKNTQTHLNIINRSPDEMYIYTAYVWARFRSIFSIFGQVQIQFQLPAIYFPRWLFNVLHFQHTKNIQINNFHANLKHTNFCYLKNTFLSFSSKKSLRLFFVAQTQSAFFLVSSVKSEPRDKFILLWFILLVMLAIRLHCLYTRW